MTGLHIRGSGQDSQRHASLSAEHLAGMDFTPEMPAATLKMRNPVTPKPMRKGHLQSITDIGMEVGRRHARQGQDILVTAVVPHCALASLMTVVTVLSVCRGWSGNLGGMMPKVETCNRSQGI